MEESVLLGTKPLANSIRHFIRDPSGVFSLYNLCECRIVQWRHDSRLLLLLNWFLASRLLFRIKAWRAGLRPSATKKLKSLQKSLKTRTRRRKPCIRHKSFLKNILTPATRKGKLKILRPWNCKKSSKNLFLLCERKMVKNMNPRPSERLSKASSGIFAKTIMDSPCLTTRNFTKCKIF